MTVFLDPRTHYKVCHSAAFVIHTTSRRQNKKGHDSDAMMSDRKTKDTGAPLEQLLELCHGIPGNIRVASVLYHRFQVSISALTSAYTPTNVAWLWRKFKALTYSEKTDFDAYQKLAAQIKLQYSESNIYTK
jgi:hypothetical protein